MLLFPLSLFKKKKVILLSTDICKNIIIIFILRSWHTCIAYFNCVYPPLVPLEKHHLCLSCCCAKATKVTELKHHIYSRLWSPGRTGSESDWKSEEDSRPGFHTALFLLYLLRTGESSLVCFFLIPFTRMPLSSFISKYHLLGIKVSINEFRGRDKRTSRWKGDHQGLRLEESGSVPCLSVSLLCDPCPALMWETPDFLPVT